MGCFKRPVAMGLASMGEAVMSVAEGAIEKG